MKAIRIFSFIFFTITLSQCATFLPTGMAKEIVESAPMPNWVPMHSNPKIGDYAIYQSLDGTIQKMEIVSQKGTLYEIKQNFISTSSLLQFMKDYEQHVFADKEGYIQEGFMTDLNSGRKISKRVAVPSDPGYIPNPKSFGLKKANLTISTKAGTFAIDSIIVLEKNFSNLGTSSKFKAMYFLSPKAKFGMVQSRVISDADLGLDNLTMMITGNRIVAYIAGEFGKLNFKDGADLIESN